MARYPVSAADEARHTAHRLRLSRHQVYSCRFCRESVKVTSARYLPESCEACGSSTWELDGRCANWINCDGVRRTGVRGRAHCHSCGYSVWALVNVTRSDPFPLEVGG